MRVALLYAVALFTTACLGGKPASQDCAGQVDGECPEGSLCIDGTCVEVCSDSAECDDPLLRCEDGACVPNLSPTCTAHAECNTPAACQDPAGARCVGGECRYALLPASVVCRASTGACDPAESCTGTGLNCPADTFACPTDQYCNTNTCVPKLGPGVGCASGAQCLSSHCVDNVCCASDCAGACDSCNLPGLEGTCSVSPATDTCRPSAGLCDVAERCDGVAVTCPPDRVLAASTLCRAAAGICDVSESCDGVNPSCPSDAMAPASQLCRAATGGCDAAEYCTRGDELCPVNLLHSAGYVCRASTSPCDPAEICGGSSTACPADFHSAAGTDPGGGCNGYTCNGTGACRTSCAGGSCSGDCVAGAWCNAGACQPDRADGQACSDACGCVAGVCGAYYPGDVDNDDYATGTTVVRLCGATPAANYATRTGDCCDSDAQAHPGQTSYYPSANTCGSFDYNCSGAAEKAYLDTNGCVNEGGCATEDRFCTGPGWSGAVTPACGVSGTYRNCTEDPICGPGETQCGNITTSTLRQTCR